MTYVLVGSAPSPFTRRLRLLMESIPHEFKAINIYEAAGAAELKRLSPTNQIPVLLEDGKPIFDSRVIFNYINDKHRCETMTLEKENALTVAESMMNGGVNKFLLIKSGVDAAKPMMFLDRNLERIETTHQWLLNWLKTPMSKEWNFVSMTVYSAYDWMRFRDIHPVAHAAEVTEFLALHAHRASVRATDARNLL